MQRRHRAKSARGAEVIAGPLGWEYEDDLAQIERFGGSKAVEDSEKRKGILRFDYLPFAHLGTLIRGARALLFPSLYEGFGLPVLEAVSLGTPVMTSNSASLAEMAGDAAPLVDPLDIRGMTKTIQVIDADSDLRAALGRRGAERAKLFSAAAYGKRVGSLYRSVLD